MSPETIRQKENNKESEQNPRLGEQQHIHLPHKKV